MRYIPVTLQDELNKTSTSIGTLLKIRSRDGRTFGLTSNNKEFTYDDGGGDVIYSPVMNTSGTEAYKDLTVGNAEPEVFINVASTFTKQEINAGLLDFAKFWVYRVDFSDALAGHYMLDYGYVGKVSAHDQIAGVLELRSLAQRLKQTVTEQYSLTCRADFGSQPGEKRFPCKYNPTALWQNGDIVSVDADEPDRIFNANYTIAVPTIPYEFALIEWITGNNAGQSMETEFVEEIPGSGLIRLMFAMPNAIQPSDTFRIRPDCGKRAQEDCIDKFDNYINFRGEPTIPVAEERSASFPGANVPGVGRGTTSGEEVEP